MSSAKPKLTEDKLTGIFPPDTKPVHVGEYCASVEPNPDLSIRRWWDGTQWSFAYWAHESPSSIAFSRSNIAYDVYQSKIYWRGLRAKSGK